MSERRQGPGDGENESGAFGRREYDRGERGDRGEHDRPREHGGRRAYDRPGNGNGDGDGGESKREEERRDDRERSPREPEPQRPRAGFRGVGAWIVIALVLAALAAGLLYWRHHHRLAVEARRRRSEVDRGPRLFVTEARLSPEARELTLPADVRGFFQSTVYGKVAGYVKSVAVDKGDEVKKGQLLGILESPEVDQQVAAAAADLVIKRRTFERFQRLVGKDFVSAQDFETTRAQYEVSQATLRQLRALQDYETLRAPFAGTVTARYVDPGALVPAATGATQSALPLVDLADLRRLRITVFVQQDAAPFLHVGDPVTIALEERPQLKIKATITRFANALDVRSRTMLCEIWVDNPYHLYPGTFVHVTLHLKVPTLPIVPSSALLIHDNKPALGVIRDSRVHFVTVHPGFDDGHTVQIIEGIKPGERVAVELPAELAEGAEVQAVEQKQEK